MNLFDTCTTNFECFSYAVPLLGRNLQMQTSHFLKVFSSSQGTRNTFIFQWKMGHIFSVGASIGASRKAANPWLMMSL